MKLIKPTAITDSLFVSCTIPETDYPEWASGTTYAIGDYVILAATHTLYRAITANTGKSPASNTSDWQRVGATNRWRMFDEKVGTVSSATGSFSVTLAPGLINALALVEVDALSAHVVMTDPVDGIVFDKTYSLNDNSAVTDGYQYFFAEIRRKRTLVVEGLTSYRNAQLTVTVTGETGATTSLGALLVGRMYAYSLSSSVLVGASIGIQDYSKKERDEWGNAYIVERDYAKRAKWSYLIQNKDLDAHQSLLAEIRAKPTVFIGGRYDATVIYGFCRDFDTVIPYELYSECSIEIEGLT